MDNHEKQLEEIIEIRNRMTSGMVKEKEALELFGALMNAIAEVKSELEQNIAKNKDFFASKHNSLLNDLGNLEDSLVRKIEGLDAVSKTELDKLTQELYTKVNEIKDSIPEETDLSSLEAKINEIEAKIPQIPDEITGEKIIEKINDANGIISMEKIEGLANEIKNLRKEIKTASTTGGVRRVFQPYIDRFTTQTDGSNRTFTLSREPLRTDTIEVSGTDFPIILDPTVDFTVVGKTLTLSNDIPAPSQGATLICKYYA